jgi:TolB-like protein/tetratricopeptide (TPR) repeat protein
MGFFAELKRRNVIRVAGVYIVVGWILVQVATALEESIGLPDWFDGLIVALLLIGLPVALIFAWAFELTPEGVVRTEAVPEGQSITSDTGRKLDFTLALAIVALVIVIVWQQSTRTDVASAVPTEVTQAVASPEAVPDDASVAVLPFSDMSAEGDQEYFSDGLTEEILNLLARAGAIEVVSRTSSFQFKDTNLGIPAIASELNVRHIVEGSVRKSGETIRVTAQLIDATTDRHLWSNTYDRPLTTENLFKIQDDVANSIFAALSEELGLGGATKIHARRMTDDLDAYALFLKARTLYQARRDLDQAEELLHRAVQMDPEFAEAWAYRAGNQVLRGEYGYTDLPHEKLLELGLDHAETALALDPTNATAIATIGNIYSAQTLLLTSVHPWSEIIALFTRALEIDPRNASALNWRGLSYVSLGKIDEGVADFVHCQQVEPYYLPCLENRHWFLADMGRDDESLAVIRDAADAGRLKSLYLHLGLLARQDQELAFKIVTNHEFALRDWHHHDELYDAFRNPGEDHSKLLASLLEFIDANPGRDPWFLEPVLAQLGHLDFQQAPIGTWGEVGRRYRQSPQFRNYASEAGFLDYWQEKGFPALCRPVGDDDFECD